MTATELYSRAMLVSMNVSAWTARKYDRKVSKEVADSHNASIDAGRYNKHLMPADAESYKALTSHIGALRALHIAQTLPWNDEGWRVLPVSNYYHYTDLMREGKHTFDRLLAEFVADYPNLRAEAQRQFNGLFNPDDYPSNVSGRYSHAIKLKPVPTGGDWRVQLSEEEIKVLAETTEASTKAAFEEAQNDTAKRLFKVVASIHERLSTRDKCKKCDGTGTTVETRKNANKGDEVSCWICNGEGTSAATFHDTLITNARELCDVLKRINLTDDAKLEELRRQTEKLATNEPEVLRDDAKVRFDTATRAQSILDAMTATYGKGLFA